MTEQEKEVQQLKNKVKALEKQIRNSRPKRWIYYPEDDYIQDRDTDLCFECSRVREKLEAMDLWNGSATKQWNDFICMILEYNDVEEYYPDE